MKRKKVENIKEEPIEEKIDFNLLIDYLEYSKLINELTENIKSTCEAVSVVGGPNDDFRDSNDTLYNCKVNCTLYGIDLGTFDARYYKTKKGEIDHDSDSLLVLEVEKLIKESPLARKVIIEYFDITEQKIKAINKEAEIYYVDKKIESVDEELKELYIMKQTILENIESTLKEKQEYQKEKAEIEIKYSTSVQKKISK